MCIYTYIYTGNSLMITAIHGNIAYILVTIATQACIRENVEFCLVHGNLIAS